MSTATEKSTVELQAIKAKRAAKAVSLLTTDEKNEALLYIAKELADNSERILEANNEDLESARRAGYDEAYLDRLALTKTRIVEFSEGLKQVADLSDPIGDVLSNWTLENGLEVEKVRVPLGVIGMIYEARPNVTVDATGLALKSGNAIVLKGGSSALNTNKMIVEIIKAALEKTKIPADAVQFIASTDREATQELFTMKEHIDVLIPRGGGALIKAVVENATVPVLETGVGNCHLYIDKEADPKKAMEIMVNAKTDRPAVCNALETLIVHNEWLKLHQELLIETLEKHKIAVNGDNQIVSLIPGSKLADENDWANEYLRLEIAIKTVNSLDEAIEHIEIYGTKHSEAIITENKEAASKFMKLVDASAVYHNASTRFTDGGALGFGAEIGISTQKLHARGPMGLPSLTTIKLMMNGNGQVR